MQEDQCDRSGVIVEEVTVTSEPHYSLTLGGRADMLVERTRNEILTSCNEWCKFNKRQIPTKTKFAPTVTRSPLQSKSPQIPLVSRLGANY